MALLDFLFNGTAPVQQPTGSDSTTNFPLWLQQSAYNLEAGETFADAAVPDVATQAVFLLAPLTRGPVTARFGGQTTGGVEVNRRGLILAFRCSMAQKPDLQNEDAENATGVLVAGGQAAA